MQDNEWLISVRETSLHVQTHTPLTSGPEQVGEANRCWKSSWANFSSFTKICSLLLFHWPGEKGSAIFNHPNSASLKLNQILPLLEANGRKQKGQCW